jgi:UPF0271 protein
MAKTERRVIILDTSALVAGFDPFSISEEQFTVPMVREEISGGSMLSVRFKTAVESGKLKVRKPNKISVDKVRASATAIGDTFFLSDADVEVLALALELKSQSYSPLIATDDYSIQNVANQLGIRFASLATFGIRYRLEWIRYCPACHRKYPADYKSRRCEICGTELKRKPLRRRSLNAQQ